MPDALTAEEVKNRFIARGPQVYSALLECLTQPLRDDERPPKPRCEKKLCQPMKNTVPRRAGEGTGVFMRFYFSVPPFCSRKVSVPSSCISSTMARLARR